jgi:hypothetical protein
MSDDYYFIKFNSKFKYEHEKFIDKSINKYYELLMESNVNGNFYMSWLNIFHHIKSIDNKNIKLLEVKNWNMLGEYFESKSIYGFNIKTSIKDSIRNWYNTLGMEWPEKNKYYRKKQDENMKSFIEKYKKYEEETILELSKLPGIFRLKLSPKNSIQNGLFDCETARRILQLSLGDKLKVNENNACDFSWKN